MWSRKTPANSSSESVMFLGILLPKTLQTSSASHGSSTRWRALVNLPDDKKDLTLSCLSLDKGFDESVRGLSVQGQSIAERLQVWAFLQEGFL